MPKHKMFTKKERSCRLACIRYLSEHFSQYLQLKSCVKKKEAGTDFCKIYDEISWLKNGKLRGKNSDKAHIIWFQKKLKDLLKTVTALKNKRVSKLFPIL